MRDTMRDLYENNMFVKCFSPPLVEDEEKF